MMLPTPQPDLFGEQTRGIDSEAWPQILEQLTAICPRKDQDERRRDNRYPFPCLMYLTPVGEDGSTPNGKSTLAAGKDLSEGGLGFYHPMPLPPGRMIVSLQMNDGHWLGFLVELSRSRPIPEGWYQSSGRFVEPAVSPMESA